MQPALHQYARAAECDRLVDLFADLFEGTDVSVGRARSTIKRAERADDIADVRIVDVAIDDVGDDVVRVAAGAYLVGRDTHSRDVMRLQQQRALLGGHALTRE